MKKIVTLVFCALLALSVSAQIEITKDGKVINEGETIEFFANEIELAPGFSIIECAPHEPVIKNLTDAPVNVTMKVEKLSDEDKLTFCSFGTCDVVRGKSATKSGTIGAGKSENMEVHAGEFVQGDFKSYNAKITVTCGSFKLTFFERFTYAGHKVLTISVNNVSRLYGEENPSFDVTFSEPVDKSLIKGKIKYVTKATKKSDVGTYKVFAEADDLNLPNYELNFVPGILEVKKAPLNISVKDGEMVYGDKMPNLPIEYLGLKNGETVPKWNMNPRYVSDVTEKTSVGTYSVSLECEPLNYFVDKIQPAFLTIKPAELIVIAENKSRMYYEDNAPLTCRYEGFRNDDTEASLIAQPSLKTDIVKTSPVGDYEIKVSGAKATNYELKYKNGMYSVTQRPLWVLISNYKRFYGDSNPQMDIQYEGFVNNDDKSVLLEQPAISLAADKYSDVGEYDILISGGKAKNYFLTYKKVGILKVIPAELSVKIDDASRLYFEDNPRFTYKVTGFKNNETINVLQTLPKIESVADKLSNVGSYPIKGSNGIARNYKFIYNDGTLNIAKRKLVANVPNISRIYGEKYLKYKLSYDGFVNNEDESVLDSKPVVISETDSYSGVGIYGLTLEGGSDNNYIITHGNVGSLSILPAPLMIKANNAERLYFDEMPNITFTYEGFKNAENANNLDIKPSVKTAVTKESHVGEYTIEAYGAKAKNYRINYSNGTLTIKKRPLVVSTNDYERCYNEVNPDITMIYDGFVNNENEEILMKRPVAFVSADKLSDVGIYQIEFLEGLAKDYNLMYHPGVLTIKKANQIINWEQSFDDVTVGQQLHLNAFSSSGLPIVYLISNPSLASVYKVGEQFVLDCIKDGSVTIRASQPGNKNYNAAERVAKVINIVMTGIADVENEDNIDFVLKHGYIQLMSDKGNYNAIVYSLNGQKIYEGCSSKIKLSSGAYILLYDNNRYKIFMK